jgi:hypothetical protein
MKVDFVKSLIALVISTLLAYACYEICDFESRKWIITGGSFLTVTIPLLLAMGLSSKDGKSGLSLKLLSWVVVFIEIGANFIFVFFDFLTPVYVIVNGLLLSVYALIYNSIYKTHI